MKPQRHPRHEDEPSDSAVSVLISYLINIGIAAIVVSLTLFLLQGVFADTQENAVESEISAVGQSFASELERVDVLSNQTDGNVTATVELPQSQNPYSIKVIYDGPDSGTRINVESGDATVDIPIANETEIKGAKDGVSVARGSTPEIRYNSTEDEILIIR